jgi:hypothetical protein
MVAGAAAPTNVDSAVSRTLADVVGGGEGHGREAVRGPFAPLERILGDGGGHPWQIPHKFTNVHTSRVLHHPLIGHRGRRAAPWRS